MRAWWWGPNFGDCLTWWLLSQLGIHIEWASPREAELFGVGSIAHRIPSNFEGFVWGTGAMFPGNPHLTCDHDVDLSRARVLALRGEDTLRWVGAHPGPVLGDSGLVVRAIAKRRTPKYRLSVLAHFDDHRLNERFEKARHIDVMSGPENIVPQIAECSRLVTSSLHGLVTADALGIESYWWPYDSSPEHARKFHDYASALGEPIEAHAWRLADQSSVDRIVDQLVGTVEEMKS